MPQAVIDKLWCPRLFDRMSSLVSNHNYRFLFSASAISNLGDGVSALAFPWLATLITRDPTLIALVAFATRLPWLLFAVLAGILTDRKDRRTLMVQADVLRLLLTCGVIALVLTVPSFPPGEEHVGIYVTLLAGLAFLLGSAEVVRDNAAQTILPSVVENDELEQANGQMWSVEQVMGSFVGPPVAGFLIAYSVPAPFTLDALTFATAAWLVWCIALPPRLAPIRQSLKVEIIEGGRWMLSHRTILQLAMMLGLINALTTAALTVLILFSQEILQLTVVGHGALLTAGAAGGVAGGLACPSIARRIGNQASLRWALVLFPIPLVTIALTSNAAVTAVALFAQMFAALLWNVVTVSYRQRLIPDNLLGRVNSIYRFLGWGMMPFGALAGGLIVSLAEQGIGRDLALRVPFLCAAVGCCLLLLYGFAKVRIR